MRELVREFNGSNTYLRYNLLPADEFDNVSLAMLTHNRIDGVVPTQFRQMDDTKQLLFNISGKVSASDLFKGTVSRTVLLRVLRGIVTGIVSAEEYRLLRQSILLSMDCIFVDLKTSETMVLCLPIKNIASEDHDLRQFFRELVFYKAKGDAASGYDHIAQIMSYLNTETYFNPRAFGDFLDQLINGNTVGSQDHEPISAPTPLITPPCPPAPPAPPQPEPIVMPEEEPEEKEDEISLLFLLQHYNAENAEKYRIQQQRKKGKKPKKDVSAKSKNKEPDNDFDFDFPDQGEIPLMSKDSIVQAAPPAPVAPTKEPERIDYGETILLDDHKNGGNVDPTEVGMKPHLIWQKNGEEVYINADHFLIGRKQSDVNYCIRNNKTVGRVHAEIITRDGALYVRDLESANHTYVNGVEIPSNQEVPLIHGSRIVFSDEEFEFRLV